MVARHIVLAAGLFVLGACPKRVPSTVSGSDDEQVDRYAAKLEELKERAPTEMCPNWCPVSRTACEAAHRTCEIAGRHTDRTDLQDKCASANEDCAQYTDRCHTCGQ